MLRLTAATLALTFALAGCASSGSSTRSSSAPAPSSGAVAAPTTETAPPPPEEATGAPGGEGMGDAATHVPEVVHTGKAYKLDFDTAQRHFAKGARCAGDEVPELIIGDPDQRNQMVVGKDKVVTYGFKYPQGTLLIRCKQNRVDTLRVLQ